MTENFGKMLKRARQERDLTLRDAAKSAGVSYAYLCRLETGAAERPKMDLLYKLVDFYALPLDKACIAAGRIPKDVFYKIVQNPDLIHVVRNYTQGA